MISYLKGKIKYKSLDFIIIDVNSVGYEVFIGADLLKGLSVGNEVEIFTHQYVREDRLDLYGFKSREDLEFFKKLIAISGIGPKSALGIFAVASIPEIKKAIIHGDPSILTKVSGIGRKTAEKIILELKESIDISEEESAEGEARQATKQLDQEAVNALVHLGYSRNEARDALQSVSPDVNRVEDRIKEALRALGKG